MRVISVAVSIVLLLVLGTSFAAASVLETKPKDGRAAAAHADQGKRKAVEGLVSAKGDKTFDVVTKKVTVHVTVNEETRYVVKGVEDADFGDVTNGQRVVVRGTRNDDGILAKTVRVKHNLGRFGHAVGTVDSYSAGSSIVVTERKSGAKRTFAVNADTEIHLPEGHTAIAVGDRVTVVAKTLDAASHNPLAVNITVHDSQDDDDDDDDDDADDDGGRKSGGNSGKKE